MSTRSVQDMRQALLRMKPNQNQLDAAVAALVCNTTLDQVVENWRPKAPDTSPPCRYCNTIGTISISMQQLRSGDEGEEAVASCARCHRRYRVDL